MCHVQIRVVRNISGEESVEDKADEQDVSVSAYRKTDTVPETDLIDRPDLYKTSAREYVSYGNNRYMFP
jgi:hypothetical protein